MNWHHSILEESRTGSFQNSSGQRPQRPWWCSSFQRWIFGRWSRSNPIYSLWTRDCLGKSRFCECSCPSPRHPRSTLHLGKSSCPLRGNRRDQTFLEISKELTRKLARKWARIYGNLRTWLGLWKYIFEQNLKPVNISICSIWNNCVPMYLTLFSKMYSPFPWNHPFLNWPL